jgi:hypothetical protein
MNGTFVTTLKLVSNNFYIYEKIPLNEVLDGERYFFILYVKDV